MPFTCVRELHFPSNTLSCRPQLQTVVSSFDRGHVAFDGGCQVHGGGPQGLTATFVGQIRRPTGQGWLVTHLVKARVLHTRFRTHFRSDQGPRPRSTPRSGWDPPHKIRDTISIQPRPQDLVDFRDPHNIRDTTCIGLGVRLSDSSHENQDTASIGTKAVHTRFGIPHLLDRGWILHTTLMILHLSDQCLEAPMASPPCGEPLSRRCCPLHPVSRYPRHGLSSTCQHKARRRQGGRQYQVDVLLSKPRAAAVPASSHFDMSLFSRPPFALLIRAGFRLLAAGPRGDRK